MAMTTERRNEVLAQLHHKLLGEAYEQPSAADVEEVAWSQACELDRVGAASEHRRVAMVHERDRADGLTAEVERLRKNAETAVAFLEKRFGNPDGHDWGDDEAARIAELLEGNVDE